MIRWVSIALLVVWVLAGCDSTGGRASSPSTAPNRLVAATGIGRAGCSPPTPFAGNELHGTMEAGRLYGIAMGNHVPPRVGETLKIVWRMTGHGELRARFTNPHGTRVPLTFGPEAHGASTYARPGDEWGTGFHFDRAGCWRIHLARTDTRGDVWLRVGPAAADG